MKSAPFHGGQKVIAVNAASNSRFENGQKYVVSGCKYSAEKDYWYVGIVGHEDGGCHYRPTIFKAIKRIPRKLKKSMKKEWKNKNHIGIKSK